MAAQSPVRCARTACAARFDSYICADPLDPDLRRATYSAVAAKLARFSSTD
jgi:hypothetical protein